MLLFLFAGGRVCAQETILAVDLGASYSLPPAGGTGIASTYANGGLRLVGTFGSGGYFHAAGIGVVAHDAGELHHERTSTLNRSCLPGS